MIERSAVIVRVDCPRAIKVVLDAVNVQYAVNVASLVALD
jgi:hypothetical protein